MTDKKKKTAGAATPNGQQKKTSTKIIAVPLDVVNMSDEEIIDAAVKRLQERYQHYLTEVFKNEKRTERKLQQSA